MRNFCKLAQFYKNVPKIQECWPVPAPPRALIIKGAHEVSYSRYGKIIVSYPCVFLIQYTTPPDCASISAKRYEFFVEKNRLGKINFIQNAVIIKMMSFNATFCGFVTSAHFLVTKFHRYKAFINDVINRGLGGAGPARGIRWILGPINQGMQEGFEGDAMGMGGGGSEGDEMGMQGGWEGGNL